MSSPVRVGFYGMSHLGLVSATCLASMRVPALGVDLDKNLIAGLLSGNYPYHEPDLLDRRTKAGANLTFSDDLSSLGQCDIVYYARDIPTTEDNRSDLSRIDSELPPLIPNLKPGALLIILSQVPPGYTRKFADKFAADLKARNVTVCYQVETLIFGRAVERALYPERYIVGLANREDELPDTLAMVLEKGHCPIFKMAYESAELAKISINHFLVASISTSNLIAGVSEQLGASWSDIAEVLKLDARIGKSAYLKPGLGIAGGNLERDLVTMRALSSNAGTNCSLLDGFSGQLSYAANWPTRKLIELTTEAGVNPKDVELAVLGLSYKEDTNSIKNSPSIAFLRQHAGYRIRAFDPVIKSLSDDLSYVKLAASANECVGTAKVVLILTPWSEFKQLAAGGLLSNKIVIDPFGIVRQISSSNVALSYASMGESK